MKCTAFLHFPPKVCRTLSKTELGLIKSFLDLFWNNRVKKLTPLEIPTYLNLGKFALFNVKRVPNTQIK
jgi:hypothetical protein